MTNLHVYCADSIARLPLPGPSAVVQFADTNELLPPIFDTDNAKMVLKCVFADVTSSAHGMRAPTSGDAARIVDFCIKAREAEIPHLVAQCQCGIGRSVALVGALSKKSGIEWPRKGTHNRRLYKLLLEEMKLPPEPEPLVSIAVRVKYHPEYLTTFLMTMRRQRYDNWEAVCVTDGKNQRAKDAADVFDDPRIRIVETDEPRGRWGHPHRQLAMSLCNGEWIGVNNDDNYLTPGYIEQLVHEGTQSEAQIVLCHALHRYSGWTPCQVGDDLSCWLARRELIRKVRWDETCFEADRNYLQKLLAAAEHRAAVISKPLVVKN